MSDDYRRVKPYTPSHPDQSQQNARDREGEGLHQVLRRLNDNLASAPHDAEKCFVSLDDHRTLVAALEARAQPPASEGLVTDALLEKLIAAVLNHTDVCLPDGGELRMHKHAVKADMVEAINEAALQAQPAGPPPPDHDCEAEAASYPNGCPLCGAPVCCERCCRKANLPADHPGWDGPFKAVGDPKADVALINDGAEKLFAVVHADDCHGKDGSAAMARAGRIAEALNRDDRCPGCGNARPAYCATCQRDLSS